MRILIAEDEPDIWKPYKIALESRGHEAIISQDGRECLKIYNEEYNNSLSSKPKVQIESEDNNRGEMSYYNKHDKSSSSSSSLSPSSSSSSSTTSFKYSPFDAVVLDYRMPEKDGLEVAKEILEMNPEQRIIFASAYVKETLEESVKELKEVVELMQKPFDADVLVDTIEDREVQEGLKKLMTNLKQSKDLDPTFEQIRDLFEGLRKIQKGRTF
jgi:CheY-like chemotaxis protein